MVSVIIVERKRPHHVNMFSVLELSAVLLFFLDENFDIKDFFMMMIRTKEIAKESSVYGAQFKRMCIAVIFCILTMHCVSFVVLSPSLRRFYEKRPHQGGKMSSLEEQKIGKLGGRHTPFL